MSESKKKKQEVTCHEDIKKLPVEEQMKWEIAEEIGVFDKVLESGWRSLTAKESGRIGGILSRKRKALSINSEEAP